MSYGNRIYFTDNRNLEHNPPGSPEALAAIARVAKNKEGGNVSDFQHWSDEEREGRYRHDYYPKPPPPDPSIRRCRDCGVITKGRTLCAPCQHIRDRGTTTYGRTCCDCGEPVARNHAQVIRCPPCQERTNQEFNRLKAERQRTRRQGVPA